MFQKKLIVVMSMLTLLLSGCAPSDGSGTYRSINQDLDAYLLDNPEQPLLSAEKIASNMQHYLQKYFSPWKVSKNSQYVTELRDEIKNTANHFLQHPGYDIKNVPIQADVIKSMVLNMQLDTYPNHVTTAMTTDVTYLRSLPTANGVYHNANRVGEGFPFDRLQQTLLPANVPILILHQTQDKQWSFVISSIDEGWVQTATIANVDEKIMHQWQQQVFVTPIKRNVTLQKFQARLGSIIPLINKTENYFEILVATKDGENAAIQVEKVAKENMALWPIPATAENIMSISKQLIGEPYGWGGLFGHRDCSSMMMDIFATVGIRLPRNSQAQAKAGEFISFHGQGNKQKLSIIEAQAKPYFSIINMDGHVMLYLGKHRGQHYVFQNVWGLHTGGRWFKPGRSVIGKAIISPIDFGARYWNVPKSDLDRAYGVTVLGK